jgi:isocitrate lyase
LPAICQKHRQRNNNHRSKNNFYHNLTIIEHFTMTPKYSPNTFRPYTPEDVKKLQGSFKIEYTLAKLGAKKLWDLFNIEPYVRALGCQTGNQAVKMVRGNSKAIYVSGWQVAADANLSGNTYPDQSLYPSNSVPALVKRINNALLRADQIEHSEGEVKRDWLVPIVADAEAGFGGPLNSFEMMKSMIEAGSSCVHYEDQLSSEKRCGHLNSKVLVPTKSFIKHLVAARLAADVCGVPEMILVARTDADSSSWLTTDCDERDLPFMDRGVRSEEGFYKLTGDPMERCVARGLAYAPYADAIWMETSTPNLRQAEIFAARILEKFPNKLLAYNCSPSFNWKKYLSDKEIAEFQDKLGEMGYRFNFITLAGWHSVAKGMFELASDYNQSGMTGYVDFQEEEFHLQNFGYTAVKHQREVGVSYYDSVGQIIDGNDNSSALKGSTESNQF